MTDVFPQRNLPDQAEAWGREIEDRIKDIQKQVSVVSNTTRNTNLVAVKSAEAADHNVRRVEVQVEALEAVVNEKTRAVLDEAIEELREAEIVMEAQFEAHDTALGEAETAIGELELATIPETMAAAVGVFIDAMMQNLTVTGVANINQVVADELYTKMAVVQKLQATESIVTKDMIATGAITSEKIAAGAVTADMVDVGQNSKWDSNGLKFYAPPFPDQAYDDWENRTPIISLTPAGDVSVTVAQGGQPTAGMEATGLVHGDVGQFNSLTVGGQDISALALAGPLGLQYVAAVETGATLYDTQTRLLTAPVFMMPGRVYRVDAQVFFRALSGMKIYMRTSGGVPTTGNTIQSEAVYSPTGSNGYNVARFSYLWQSSSRTIPPEGDLVYIGLFVEGLSSSNPLYIYGPHSAGYGPPRTFMTVEDLGPDLEVDWQPISSATPPKKDYSATATYRWWRGFAQDGRHTVDSRATVAGRLWGTDMHEQVIMGVSDMMAKTSGSSVLSASVTIRRSDSAGYTNAAWNIGFASSYNAPGTMPSVTWIATNQNFTWGQSRTFSVPSAHLDKLRTGAFRSIVVGPTHAASSSSYGIVDVAATKVAYKYRK